MSNTKNETNGQPFRKPPKRSKLRWALRQARRVIVLISVGLLLFVVGFVIYAWDINYRGDLAVRQIRSELSDRGLLELYPQALSFGKDDNGIEDGTSAAYWRAAMSAQPDAGQLPIPVVATVNISDIKLRQQYHADTVSAMREAIASNQIFFDLVDAAQSAELGRFIAKSNIAYQTDGLPILGDTRSVARWLLVRANLAESTGDGELFTESILAILNLNNTLQLDPGYMSKLVVLSIDAMGRQGITDGLSRVLLNEEQLGRLIEALEHRRDQYDLIPMLGIMVSNEFHQTTAIIQNKIAYWEAHQRNSLSGMSQEEKKDMESFFGFPAESNIFSQVRDDAILAWCPGSFQLENTGKFRQAIADYDQIKSVVDDEKNRWTLVEHLIDDDEEDESISLFDIRGRLTDVIDIAVTARSIMHFDNSLATAIAALHAERYRIKNNAWPATLTDAIGHAPIDPYGQILQYRSFPDGVIIYSIGPNGLDEEGYGQYDFNDQTKYEDPDDFAVRLYHPELRNALPPPDEAIMPEDDYDW